MYSSLLLNRINSTNSHLCAGFDPDRIRQGVRDVAGLRQWTFTLIEVLHDILPAFKFQYAYYEAFGPEGLSVLKAAIDRSRNLGVLTILDAKRSDIETTLLEYVSTAFALRGEDEFSWNVDAMTINPYLSLESLPVILRSIKGAACGIYLVVSPTAQNKHRISAALQRELVTSTKLMADTASGWVHDSAERVSPPFLGFVVSAVEPGLVEYFSNTYPQPLLIPGIGSQGGRLAEIRQSIERNPLNLFSISRGIYPSSTSFENPRWGGDARKLALELSQCMA